MRYKKLLTTIITFIFLLSISLVFVGCNDDGTNQDGKYEVTIRIACDDGETWVFTPDTDEIRIERDYDGREHKYYIDAYQIPEKPGWEDKWISPAGEGANVFQISILYVDNEGNYNTQLKRVCDSGKYIITVDASKTSTLWKFREVYLYVTVK